MLRSGVSLLLLLLLARRPPCGGMTDQCSLLSGGLRLLRERLLLEVIQGRGLYRTL